LLNIEIKKLFCGFYEKERWIDKEERDSDVIIYF